MNLLASAPQTTTDVKSDWRTEITGRGRYFHWRSGSGKDRKYMRGGKIDKLPAERLRAYEKNVSHKNRKKRSTLTRRDSGNNEKHIGEMARVGTDLFGSES